MSQTDEVHRGFIAALTVVGADVGERRGIEVTVDEYDGNVVLADPFQKGRVPVAGDDDNAVDFTRDERQHVLLLVFLVFHRVHDHCRKTLCLGLADDHAGDIGEIGVVDARDEQSDDVRPAGRQPFGQQVGNVIAALGLSSMSRSRCRLMRYLSACPLSTREIVEIENPVLCEMVTSVSFAMACICYLMQGTTNPGEIKIENLFGNEKNRVENFLFQKYIFKFAQALA